MADNEIIKIKKDALMTKDQLSPSAGTTQTLIVGARETIMVEEGPLKLSDLDIGDSFILGHPTLGVLGTSKLGYRGGTTTLLSVVNYNNRFNENFRDTDYIDLTTSTGTLNTTNNYYRLNTGSTLNSTVIAFDDKVWTTAKIVMNHYINVMDSCGTTTGWTAENAASTPIISKSWYADGNQSLSMGKSGTTDTLFAYTLQTGTTNLEGRYVEAYLYLKNKNAYDKITVSSGTTAYIDLGTAGTANANWYYIYPQIGDGVTQVLIDVDDPDEIIGTGAVTSTIDFFRLGFIGTEATGTSTSGDYKLDRITYKSKSSNCVIDLSADNGDNWDTFTENIQGNFTTSGTVLRYRLTAGTRTEISKLWVQYNE